jgi:hypothetical protein
MAFTEVFCLMKMQDSTRYRSRVMVRLADRSGYRHRVRSARTMPYLLPLQRLAAAREIRGGASQLLALAIDHQRLLDRPSASATLTRRSSVGD